MDFPTPEMFFDFNVFAHASLWDPQKPVWSAFHSLKKYLTQIPLGQIEIEIPKNVFLKNREQISIGEGTILEPGVMIEGPCIIGKNCVIRHGAYLRGYVILGDQCVVGHSSEVKGSIFLNEAHAPHLSYIGDSILGHRVNLGAGVKCANVRLDRSEIAIVWEGKKISTGLKKMGALIGDRAQIGCNCVLNPGTMVGPDTLCHPLLDLSGFLPPQSIVRASRGWTVESKAETLLKQLGALS